MSAEVTHEDLRGLLEHELEEGWLSQELYDALQSCEDWSLLADLAIRAKDEPVRWISWTSLSNVALAMKSCKRELDEGIIDALERVSEAFEDTRVCQNASDYVRDLRKQSESRNGILEPADLCERMSAFNPQLGALLARKRDSLDLSDPHTLDLAEYAVWLGRDKYASRLARGRSKLVYGLLPPERKAHVDGEVREYGWWHSYAEQYFIAKSLVEAEDDAGLLEWGAVHAEARELRLFALARLSGWCAPGVMDDYESFWTYECERLEGYPPERLARLLSVLVKRNQPSEETVRELMEKATG